MFMHVVHSAPHPAHRRFTVLCIHNTQPTLSLHTDMLEASGYRAFAAPSVSAAMAVFVAQEVDVIVAGHLPGGVSGAELSIFMKQLRPDVSVILLLGTAQLPATLLRQVDACVEKGRPAEDLLSCLQAVVARQPSDRERGAGMRLDA